MGVTPVPQGLPAKTAEELMLRIQAKYQLSQDDPILVLAESLVQGQFDSSERVLQAISLQAKERKESETKLQKAAFDLAEVTPKTLEISETLRSQVVWLRSAAFRIGALFGVGGFLLGSLSAGVLFLALGKRSDPLLRAGVGVVEMKSEEEGVKRVKLTLPTRSRVLKSQDGLEVEVSQ